MSTNDFIKIFLAEKRLSYSPKTIDHYRKVLRMVEAFLAPTPMEQAVKADFVRFFTAKIDDERLERSSVASYQTKLNSFYKWMVQEGYCTENPLGKITKIKSDRKLPVYLTIQEIKQMIEVAPTVHSEGARWIRTLYFSGVRVTELTLIRKRDLQAGQIKVFGKGAKERVVEVPPWFFQDLQEACAQAPPETLLFDYSPRTVEEVVRKIGAAARITKQVTPHKLRHSFATHMAQNNANVEAIRIALGHNSLNTTQLYMHLASKDVRDQVNATHPGYQEQI